jgi:hypothetical protein
MGKMADKQSADEQIEKTPEPAPPPGRSKDEVALELMKFIAVQTGYGKGFSSGAGFQGKPGSRTPEEYADALLQLFEKCRTVIGNGR